MKENIILAVFALLPALIAFLLYLFFARFRPAPDAGTSWPRLVAGNGLVLLFLLSLAILGGELYYRFAYDSSDSFGLTKNYQRWFSRHFHYNNAAVRDNIDYQRMVPAGKRRIAFLGDSFAAGHGVKNVEDRFANLLRKKHPEWEVHMVADLGWDTGFHLDRLRALGRQRYEMDTLVLVYCLNDISDITPEWQKISEWIFSRPSPGLLVESSYLLNTLYYRLFAQRHPDIANYFSFVGDAYRGPVWQKQRQRLTLLRDIAQRQGAELRVVTFPFLNALGPDYPYRDIHAQLDDLWRELGVAHLDLLDVYGDYSAQDVVVNPYDAHPNERAHAMAADAIDAFMAQPVSE